MLVENIELGDSMAPTITVMINNADYSEVGQCKIPVSTITSLDSRTEQKWFDLYKYDEITGKILLEYSFEAHSNKKKENNDEDEEVIEKKIEDIDNNEDIENNDINYSNDIKSKNKSNIHSEKTTSRDSMTGKYIPNIITKPIMEVQSPPNSEELERLKKQLNNQKQSKDELEKQNTMLRSELARLKQASMKLSSNDDSVNTLKSKINQLTILNSQKEKEIEQLYIYFLYK